MLGIENFEQGGRRIAPEIGAQLIDFIQHENRIARACAPYVLDDLAGKRANIRTPVAPDFRFVAHASERNTDELPAHGRRDGASERRLPDARRPDKARDRRFALRPQLEHGQIFEDAFLDFFEIVMIAVEDFVRFDNVHFFHRQDIPWQRDKPIEIGSRDCVFRRGGRHSGQPPQLAFRLFLCFVGQACLFDFLSKLFDLALRVIALAQFALDRSQLLAQEVFALALADFLLHLVLNLAAQLENFEFLGKLGIEKFHPLPDGDLLKNKLFRDDRQVRKIRRDVIREPARIFDIDHDGLKIIRQLGREFDDALELADNGSPQRLEINAAFVFLIVGKN